MDGPARGKYPRPIHALGCFPNMTHMQARQTTISRRYFRHAESLFMWSHVKGRDTLVLPMGVSKPSTAIPNNSRTLI